MKKLNDEAELKYKAMKKDIGDVERSITQLMKSRDQLLYRYKYLSSNINTSGVDQFGHGGPGIQKHSALKGKKKTDKNRDLEDDDDGDYYGHKNHGMAKKKSL